MIGSLITFFAVGLVALVAISVIWVLLGVVFSLAFGIATFLLLNVAPILLLVYLFLRVVERLRRPKALPPADNDWVDSGH